MKITGVVVDLEKKPIANAKVVLKNTTIESITNSEGAFTLDGTINTISNGVQQSMLSSVTIQNEFIVFNINKKSKVSISVIDVVGRNIFSVKNRILFHGHNYFNLSKNLRNLPNKLYIINIQLDNRKYVFKTIYLDNVILLNKQKSISQMKKTREYKSLKSRYSVIISKDPFLTYSKNVYNLVIDLDTVTLYPIDADELFQGAWLLPFEGIDPKTAIRNKFLLQDQGNYDYYRNNYKFVNDRWVKMDSVGFTNGDLAGYSIRNGFLSIVSDVFDGKNRFIEEVTWKYNFLNDNEVECRYSTIFTGTSATLVGKWNTFYLSANDSNGVDTNRIIYEFRQNGSLIRTEVNTNTVSESKYEDRGEYYLQIIEEKSPIYDTILRFYSIENGKFYMWHENPDYLTREGFAPPFNITNTSFDINNPEGMKLIAAKNKTYTMGSSFSEYEKPEHEVTFDYDFWMDETEVTQNDYYTLIGIRPWANASNKIGRGEGNPASLINWHMAIYYCNARSKRDGLDTAYAYDSLQWGANTVMWFQTYNTKLNHDANGYRLPTEAEWEYACRAGSSTKFHWGEEFKEGYCTIPKSYFGVKVGESLPNAYGLNDMSGSVWEWVQDIWQNSYKNAPNDGSAYEIIDTNNNWIDRGLRGNGYISPADSTDSFRSSFRNHAEDNYNSLYGLRCVLVKP